MSTQAQILANQANAQKSRGPVSEAGKEASSKNRTTHGLCYDSGQFYLLENESAEMFNQLSTDLWQEHRPNTPTERIIVNHMAQHEWLRGRAIRFQAGCVDKNHTLTDKAQFALYLRYETTHERAFFKCLNELQKLREQRRKEQIGFESQNAKQAAQTSAAATAELKKQIVELQKEVVELKKEGLKTAEVTPGGRKMAA